MAALVLPLSAAFAQETLELDEIKVSATRGGGVEGKTPQKITVITREEIENQLSVTTDQGQVLNNLVPGYSPSRQKLTNSGETFRGRNPLFLVDGVPQSNPLRDGSRDGYTIDLSMVERIEVIHGASAEHGLGATGGIINFVTRRPESATLRQRAGISVTAPTDYESDGLGYKANYRVEGSRGDWDFLLGGTYQSRGRFYDADGRPIGVDNTQGDIMDSDSYDLLLKLGYWLDDNRNLEFSVNRFQLEGDGDYEAVVPEDARERGIPATSVRGTPEGEPPMNEVLTTSLSYHDTDFVGANLTAQLYSQQFKGRYGGGHFGTFQDPAYGNDIFDQSQNESDKLGAKLTLSRGDFLDNRLSLTGGLDLLQDETRQILAATGREWVPETTFRNYAPFLQAEYLVTDRLSIQSGLRYEYAELDVDTYQTLASYGSRIIEGGNPSFNETLFNAGFVFQATDATQLFANYSEGFGMADVGRVLRAPDANVDSVDEFLDLQPVVTDNREIGLRFNQGRFDAELSYFESDSDLGSRLGITSGGVYEVNRERVEISGFEASAGVRLNDAHRLSATYAATDGRSDTDDDGRVDTDLDAANIAPDQLSLRWTARWSDKLSTQLQANHFFDRNFGDVIVRDDDGNVVYRTNLDFDGFTLVDLSGSYRLPVGQLSVGIANLFNEDYITYYSQSVAQSNAGNYDSRYFAGRGRTLTVGYDIDF